MTSPNKALIAQVQAITRKHHPNINIQSQLLSVKVSPLQERLNVIPDSQNYQLCNSSLHSLQSTVYPLPV